jgi:outer membrane protein TolC
MPPTPPERLLFLLCFLLAGCRSGSPPVSHGSVVPPASSGIIQSAALSYKAESPAEPIRNVSSPLPSAPLPLILDDCIRLALERHPRVAALRLSLAATQDGRRALENLRVPLALAPELPLRRQQFDLGVQAASAALCQAERDAVYAVQRTYFSVLFAREQERVAQGVVESLSTTRTAAKESLEEGDRDVTSADVRRTTVYLRLAQTKQTQATQGSKRALAALKEAVSLEQHAPLEILETRLRDPDMQPNREEVRAAALARRGDLLEAGILAEVTCLEIDAQASNHFKRKMETFASGTDIHARQVPDAVRNSEYRPGALPPEMPTLLVGTMQERVERARSLSERARAVYETARNLVALEAEDAFLRWEEAAGEAQQAKQAAEAGDKLAADLKKEFAARLKVKVEDVIGAGVLAAQARSQYNEYIYRKILTLADLERITGGGFHGGLTELAGPAPKQEKETEKKGKDEEKKKEEEKEKEPPDLPAPRRLDVER